MRKNGLLVWAAALGLGTSALHGATVTIGVDPAFQQEAVIMGSIASGGSFSTRILWDATSESRGVWEFSLPALPAGGVYTSASLAYTVNEGNEGPGIASQLKFFSYPGNGRYDVVDAHQVATTEGLSPLLFSSAGWSRTHALSPARVNAIRSGGSNWYGLVAWQETFGYYTGVGRGTFGAPAPRLTYTAEVPLAGTLTTTALFDVEATGGSGGYAITEGSTSINAQEVAWANVDRRGIMEFHLGGLPAGAVITAASLTFDVHAYTYDPSGGGPRPRIYGYVGDGQPQVADATRTSLLLAGTQEIANLGLQTIHLDPAAVHNLLAGGDILGILVRGSEDGHQVGFYTHEANAIISSALPVSLSITYVPEPAALGLVAIAGLGLLARRR